MTIEQKKLVWKIVLWANWVVIFWFWWQGSGDLVGTDVSLLLIALGRLAGLAAGYMILQQFFFMGRLPWLERVFGLDALSRIHHTNGNRGLVLLLLHPILLIIGNSALFSVSWWAQTKIFLFDYADVWKAAIGLFLFVLVVVCSISVARMKLKYESWYFVHLLVYAAVGFSFAHQFTVGTDIVSSQIFYGYWALLYIVVFGVHAGFRFVRPVYMYFKHKFVVSRVVRESANVVSIYIGGDDLPSFDIQPGQFMILRFFHKGLWWQAHPFSLSFVPHGKELRVTVKELGDFTKQLALVPAGTKILIDGPYGVFTDLFSVKPKALLIAGGIGITPVRAMMEVMAGKHKDVTLLYGNRTEADIVFKSEIDVLARDGGAKVFHVLSGQEDYAGEKGNIDAEKIKRLVPDVASRDVFLCGPPPMMNGIIAVLESMGVPRRQVHYEKFSLS